jgi:hypothetical protein
MPFDMAIYPEAALKNHIALYPASLSNQGIDTTQSIFT